jgi:hypothetical protein
MIAILKRLMCSLGLHEWQVQSSVALVENGALSFTPLRVWCRACGKRHSADEGGI